MMILKKVLMILMNYITKNDLAKSLDVSLSTIEKKLKELPHYKWGSTPQSRVMFKANEI
jgi:predicted transcriptional regulator